MAVAIDDLAWSVGSGSTQRAYKATSAGIAGATAPNGTGSSFNDGGVTWRYVGLRARFAPYGSIGALI
jgi:hypothetical protein